MMARMEMVAKWIFENCSNSQIWLGNFFLLCFIYFIVIIIIFFLEGGLGNFAQMLLQYKIPSGNYFLSFGVFFKFVIP